ncbi:MAG: hypothetical protein GXY76_14250 [Chloroflexi bacterium]|nr:hypothetical protein [Chloroflexota bacterium]
MQTMRWKGHVIQPGVFEGRIHRVREQSDLRNIDSSTLAILDSCPKHTAALAINQAGAVINITNSLTAHLLLGLPPNKPFAVCTELPATIPEGEVAVIRWDEAPVGTQSELPFVPSRVVPGAERWGPKAARLAWLAQRGYRVPALVVVPLQDVATWLDEALPMYRWEEAIRALRETEPGQRPVMAAQVAQRLREATDQSLLRVRAATWLEEHPVPFEAPWAVRSSGAGEDSADDAMAGSYSTVLNVRPDGGPDAIAQVILSGLNPELVLGLPPRPNPPAVLVQPMVKRPWMSGALFVKAPGQLGGMIMEGTYGGYADRLMDGTGEADLQAFASYDLREINLTRWPAAEDRVEILQIVRHAFERALEIYQETGWGDLEYVIDQGRELVWVQARPLPRPKEEGVVERVDRVGFHPWVIHFYKQIAFRIPEANCTSAPPFRLVVFGPGDFGYTAGIRQRDETFHERTRQNPALLDRVTDFGWDVEHRMAQMVAAPGSVEPAQLLDQLTLHAAVQAPFSMPVGRRLHARYNSVPLDGYNPSAWFLEFFGTLPQELTDGQKAQQIAQLLYVPVATLSILEALRRKLAVAARQGPLLLSDAEPILACETRDILVPGTPKYELACRPVLEELEQMRRDRRMITMLESTIARFDEARRARHMRADEFLRRASVLLDEPTWACLRPIGSYLAMKAETNETHSIYRGTIFLHLGKLDLPELSPEAA